MHTFGSLAATLDAVGQTYGPGPWLEVSQERVDAFADSTGDRLAGVHAPAFLVLSLLPRLSTDVVAYGDGVTRVNYGLDRVRFPRQLRVGERVRAAATIAAARELPTGVQLSIRWTIEVEGDAEPACVADAVVRLVP